jgi:hypothetical protein
VFFHEIFHGTSWWWTIWETSQEFLIFLVLLLIKPEMKWQELLWNNVSIKNANNNECFNYMYAFENHPAKDRN